MDRVDYYEILIITIELALRLLPVVPDYEYN
jgi:hypothetical protein